MVNRPKRGPIAQGPVILKCMRSLDCAADENGGDYTSIQLTPVEMRRSKRNSYIGVARSGKSTKKKDPRPKAFKTCWEINQIDWKIGKWMPFVPSCSRWEVSCHGHAYSCPTELEAAALHTSGAHYSLSLHFKDTGEGPQRQVAQNTDFVRSAGLHASDGVCPDRIDCRGFQVHRAPVHESSRRFPVSCCFPRMCSGPLIRVRASRSGGSSTRFTDPSLWIRLLWEISRRSVLDPLLLSPPFARLENQAKRCDTCRGLKLAVFSRFHKRKVTLGRLLWEVSLWESVQVFLERAA